MLLITLLEIKSTYPKHVTCNIRCATLPVSMMLKAFHSINCWIIQFIFNLHNNHTEFVNVISRCRKLHFWLSPTVYRPVSTALFWAISSLPELMGMHHDWPAAKVIVQLANQFKEKLEMHLQ